MLIQILQLFRKLKFFRKFGSFRNLSSFEYYYYFLNYPIKDWGRISVGLSEHLYEPEIVSRLNQAGVGLNSQVMTMDIGSEAA